MNSKTTVILEYTWLIIGFGALVAAAHRWYTVSFDESLTLFAMVLVSALMYTLRRRLRLKQNTKPKQ